MCRVQFHTIVTTDYLGVLESSGRRLESGDLVGRAVDVKPRCWEMVGNIIETDRWSRTQACPGGRVQGRV